MKKLGISLLLLAALLAVVAPAGAQTLTGTIGGRVTDEQGGVLPGVTVTLTGKTGAQTQVTDARGEFRFVGLNVGTYEVKAELQGFRLKEEKGLDLGIGKTIDLKMALQVGGLTETVEVAANAVQVDTTTTATDTTMSQDLLFAMPISRTNPAVNILNNAPGINSGSAFGSASGYGSSLMLDGVDTRDPENGSAWTFFNYNIIEEVQVGGVGAPAEYGGFTGALVNTITKGGGNKFSSLNEFRYTGESLSGNNVGTTELQQNPALGNAAIIKKLTDYTVQLGGPVKTDKLFFFASVQRYSVQDDPSGPRTLHTEVSPRFNGKVTFQPTPNDNIIGSVQVDSYNQTGRAGFPGSSYSTQQQTVDQDSPEAIWNAQYRKVFGSSTFLETKFTGYWGYYDLNPIDMSPVHYDGETGGYSGGAGSVSQYDRTRNQLNASLSKYANFKGSHSFKFGAEIERSSIRNRSNYTGPNNTYFYDYGGVPYLAYGYSYDLQGKIGRNSFYGQDQWKIGRITANIGVRADQVKGSDKTTGKQVYSTFSVGPRLGVAVDVLGTGKSVLRGYYGRMYEGANFSPFERAVSGATDWVTYEVSNNWKTLTEVDRSPVFGKYSVDKNIKQLGMDEFNATWEQMLNSYLKLSVTGIYRNNINFINSVFPGATWTPFTRTVPTCAQCADTSLGGTTFTAYKWANKGAVPEQYLITNYAGFEYKDAAGNVIGTANPYKKYQGLMLVLQKAMRNRWTGQLSYVWSRTKGTIDNSGAQDQWGYNWQTPNAALTNSDGLATYDRTHEFKAYLSYQIPRIEVALNGYFRTMSGTNYAAYQRLSASTFNYTRSIDVNVEPQGSRRTPMLNLLDLRAEKVFSAGIHRFGVYMDIQNMFNSGTVTGVQSRYPNRTLTYTNNGVPTDTTVYFGAPSTLTVGRQATLGLRWSF